MSALDAYYLGLVIFLVGGAPVFLLIGFNAPAIGRWLERRRRPRRHVHPPLPANDM